WHFHRVGRNCKGRRTGPRGPGEGGDTMGALQNPETVKNLIDRLRRIEGQARGIQRMLEEGRPCRDVIIQLTALRNAVNKVAVAVIVENLEACLLNEQEAGDRRLALEEAKQLFLSL